MSRFQDQNLLLSSFEEEVFVECPKCALRASITKEEPTYYSVRKLKCPNCFYSQPGKKESYHVEFSCHCANCVSEIKVDIPSVNEKVETIALKCPGCGQTEDYKPRNIKLEWVYEPNGRPADKYFNLPLWLTENVKGEVLWAINYKHLDYLKQYIQADLRERNGRLGWTMVEKLPEWMKSAKNRESVIKAIEKLEKK